MPILFNFHIPLATFYIIFGTNILIQCPVPVPVCCMFYVSQKTNIKWSPNGIKTYGAYFWNVYDFWEVKLMRDGAWGGHEAGGAPAHTGRAPNPRGPLVRWLTLFFGHKKANFWKNIWAKVSIQSELRISGYIRNGERAEYRNAETERDRETYPISEGLSPLPRHGDHVPEGKPFSHLGRRSRKKKKKGGSPPLLPGAPERRRGPSSSPRSTPTTSPPLSPTLPSSMQQCNPSFTRCNLYLDMMLNAIYYFPMMYDNPMMFE